MTGQLALAWNAPVIRAVQLASSDGGPAVEYAHSPVFVQSENRFNLKFKTKVIAFSQTHVDTSALIQVHQQEDLTSVESPPT